ncbi:uncharacterized protein LOC100649850 isoform X3 [Bombus terrestris]|uniref:Uncharacterized protein LOC100649850 isoform X3 n=1 Tax=Bombus terrestris TaxID=30195 RepID=A0A9C6SGS9_BOMTE|nr:uncharacterized protein LOC100649850 isoform X3 [Bombus terrestris]
MFGTKLRTWMEAHIVRSKKKKDRKGKGEKGFDSNSNSPRNGSHRSPALHQVHPVDSPSRNVDEIRLHGEDGNRCGTVTASSGTSAGTGSVNLSSPESAYSTGYSTDGTSPGTSYPPEYYINIRTGTHYFQSNANANAGTATGNYSNNNNNNSSSKNNNNNNNGRPKKPSDSSDFPVACASLLSARSRHGRFEGNVEPSVSGCVTMFSTATVTMDKLGKDVVRSNEYGRTSKIGDRLPEEDLSVQRSALPKERRTEESFSAESSRSNLTEPPPPSSIPPPLLSPTVQSPRERSRIRTNPWLSANSSGSSTTTGFKSRLNIDDTSSGSGLKLTESSGSASDVNASSARVGRARRELKQESLSAGRSPINQNWRIASGMEIRPKIALSVQRRNSSSSSTSSGSSTNSSSSDGGSNVSSVAGSNGTGGSSSNDNEDGNRNGNEKENGNGNGNRNGSSASSITRSARSSEDDITLNEMMGKFDESYVYEKETDILSDSDPTDCEDYIESLSDLDAVRDGADENDPLGNDDFDYIDNGSFLDLDNLDCTGRFTNTGHCTYFAFAGELARRSSRLRESLMKRRNRDDAATAAAAAMLQRTISAKNTAKKQTARHKKQPTDEKQQSSEKRKKRCSQRRKPNFDKRDPNTGVIGGIIGRNNDRNGDDDDNNDDDEETAANLNRVLVERMLLKNSGFNQGSRSVGGTPICLRRKKQNCDVNKNLSPLRSTDERSSAGRLVTGDLDVVKRRSNSVSYVNGNLVRRRLTTTDNNTYMTTFASEIALIEADKEADKKYRELILEAENILVNMQKNQTSLPIVPSPSRKFHNGLTNKRVELIKNTELNIELALSKSRNSQPELQSGSIKDLEHTSPKRQQFVQPCSPMRRFVERNVSPPMPGTTTATFQSSSIKCSIDSPLVSRRKATATVSQRQSPDKSMLRCSRPRVYENQDPDDYDGRRVNARMATASTTNSPSAVTMFNCNGIIGSDQCATRSQTSPYLVNRPRCTFLSHTDSFPGISRRELRTSRSSLNAVTKEEGVTSSSSDSEERCDIRRRAPLMTFRSVDMGPIKEGSSYCPQSEPVKRKVYAGSATYGRIQKTLGEHITLRNSDGDTATDDTDDSRRSLKEKVARLRQERLAANASVNAQDSQIFQHQLSRLRRQMLMQTIEGLKRSLEDQSATLKQTCLEPINCQSNNGLGAKLSSIPSLGRNKHFPYTKSGSLKDSTECAPNNGYYFLPLYDKGEYVLKVDPPRGWSFEPTEILLVVDGTTDACSEGKDINFTFKGFGITGRVTSLRSDSGPKGVTVSLYKESNKQVPVGTTVTVEGGIFYFTPIQPGQYVLVASHPTWMLKVDTVKVTVREGNTELPDGSLVIYGYDVSGRVTSEEEAVSGVTFVLFGNGVARNCATTPITKDLESRKPLCHVVSDKSGKFMFPSLSPGEYKLVPYYIGAQTKFDVQPPELSFKVNHSSVLLRQGFKVTGFTVNGIVRTAINGDPLPGAKVLLSQKQIAITNEHGKYVLDNIKAGQYILKVESEDLLFDDKSVKISPNSPELPVLIPAAYKVHGKVSLSAEGGLDHRKVSIQNTATTFTKEIGIDTITGEFSTYLTPDTYQLSVIVSAEERAKGLQFFPLQQTIYVSSRPVGNINFLQLKATLTGTVKCLPQTDCSQASVTLKVLDGVTIKTIQTKVSFDHAAGQYQFTDVLPGHYEVLIDNDVFCWANPSYRISVTSERSELPPFEQTGFSATFISSHDTTVEYSKAGELKKLTLALNKGSTKHCISEPGMYTFTPKSCHVYEKSSHTWNTNTVSPILLHSTEHSHIGSILSRTALDGIKVKIENATGEVIMLGPLKSTRHEDLYKYEFEFKAKTDNVYTITPLSNILLFSPTSLKVLGVNDCQDDIATFVGDLGKIIAGRINPPLEGVTVKIFGNDKAVPIHTLDTQEDGTYSIGLLDGKVEYSVTAEKEGFVITGPDSNGVFAAHKLAEIIVQVSDQADNVSLQGVLLSLSGEQSYRKNSITGENGKLIFNSLSPGEYYLRPMMKEYRFDPPSKMIKVVEGATVKINLYGKKVAFSAYGSVTSLNGEPEAGLLVEVQGQGDCDNLQEEATTEENGSFRIRGLQPTCTYVFRLKPNAEVNAHIQRTSPISTSIQTSSDIRGLRLVAFHPIARTDVSVHVLSVQPEHYRTLKVKLCREDTPDSPIHTSRLNTQQLGKVGSVYNAGFLVHLPPLQADGKKYFVQLESSLSHALHKYRSVPFYFEANSSFKYVKLTFNAERKIDHSDMNQTSVVALPFIMFIAVAFFNREKLWLWLNALIERWPKPAPISRSPIQAVPVDPRADDIIVEQIMNINKRKTKPRKV